MQKLKISSQIDLLAPINWGVFLVLSVLFFSCSYPKSFTYFKTLPKDTTISAFVSPEFESKIQKKDVLGISVSSLNSELDAQFNNLPKMNADAMNNNQNIFGFKINDNGQIDFHFIGKVKVEGMTKKQLKEKLERELMPFMKEPIVSVQYMNKKVTVIGDVATPKIFYLSEEQLPLLDVIVNCGDLQESALASDILVIRDSSSMKIVKHINLEDHSIFSSPWYYVKADDIIYVKKDVVKYDKDERRSRTQITVSLIASVVSLLVVLLNTLLK
ncbi:MAG: polysaccharide biosynthesis/export family protein [Bacteroidota bacterium]